MDCDKRRYYCGCQKKIFRKFSSRKINFFKNSNLCAWIDKYLPSFWYAVPPSMGEYLHQITARLREADQQHSLIPNMKAFYVEQELRHAEFTYGQGKKKKRTQPRKLTSVYDSIKSNRITFIEGPPGAGKSQMLRHAGRHYADPINYIETQRIPIYIDFRDLCETYDCDITRMLKDTLSAINPETSIESCDFILLVDAVDEHPDGQRKGLECLHNIFKALGYLTRCKAVFTARPFDAADIDELMPQELPRFEIIPLTLKKVTEFFQHICRQERITKKLLDDLRNSLLFQQLPMTPIAAILLAHLIEDEAADLPSNLTELYQRYSELMLGRWDMKKGIESQKEFEAAQSVVMEFARYSVENSLPQVSEKEARKMFSTYLAARNLEIDSEALFGRVTSRSGILQRNEAQGAVYFKHLSFAEFFYAMHKHIHHDPAFVDTRIYDPDWRNVFFFYIGLKKDCEDLIRVMLQLRPQTSDDRFFRIAHFGDYLMAAYTTPYKVVEEAIQQMLQDAASLYSDIADGAVNCPLSILPQIRLLEVMKLVVSSCYGYHFFLKAMESSALSLLDDDTLDDQHRGYAMFFLSVCFVMLEQPNPFDGLIDHLKDRLPLPVQWGISYESDRVGHHSALVRKQNRKLIQAVRRSPQLMEYTKKMHILPVAKLKILKEKTDKRQ